MVEVSEPSADLIFEAHDGCIPGHRFYRCSSDFSWYHVLSLVILAGRTLITHVLCWVYSRKQELGEQRAGFYRACHLQECMHSLTQFINVPSRRKNSSVIVDILDS